MEDKIKKLYKLLDLEHGASIENVKKAFRELSHIWHPDNHFKKSESVQARAEEKFKEISQAYQELKEHLDKEDRSVQEEREAEETRKSKEEEARQEEKARQEREEERRVEEQKKREQEERARKERERKERAYREETVNKSYEETQKKTDGWHWVFYVILGFPLLLLLLGILSALTSNDQTSIDKPINSANTYQTQKAISDQEAELKITGELEKAAKVLNKNTPRMVDEDTRMDASTVGPGFRVNINYTLPKHSAGEIDADQIVQIMRPTLKNYACSKKNMKLLLQYGADFVYLYHDKDGMLITSITIDRNDCGLREISLK